MKTTKKVITAAGIIAIGIFVLFGVLLYKVGENMVNMSRCGCRKRNH